MAFDSDFLEKNKSALIEELGEGLSFVGNILDEIIQIEPSEHSFEQTKNMLMAMSYKLGYINAVFNQYFIMSNGFPPEKRKIGFHSLVDKEKKEND